MRLLLRGYLLSLFVLMESSVGAATWTNVLGGKWEDQFWDTGLPMYAQAIITNEGNKTVLFDSRTYTNYPSRPVFSLFIAGTDLNTNTLVLETTKTNQSIGRAPGGPWLNVGINGALVNNGFDLSADLGAGSV